MAATMNLTGNGLMAVVGGYPQRLLSAWDSIESGVIPKLTGTVTAIVTAESGTADVHLGLFRMPTSSGGGDNALVVQSDALGVRNTATTLTVTVPDQTLAAPACYVVRLWCDNVTGSSAETVSRDGTTAAANLPRVPTGVSVASISVS